MSRLSQLNKNDAHKALAALAQRQQAAATQFDGSEAFSAILSAHASQSDAIEDNGSRKEQDREPQDEPLPKRVMLGGPKKPPAPTAEPSAPQAKPVSEKSAAGLAPAHANQPARPQLQAAPHASQKPDKPADQAEQQPEPAAAAAITVDAKTVVTGAQIQPVATADAEPVAVAPVQDAQQTTEPVLAVDALPLAVALPVAASEPTLPLHMLLALGGNIATAINDKIADAPVAAPLAAAVKAAPGLVAQPTLQPAATVPAAAAPAAPAAPVLAADATIAPALPVASRAATADLLTNVAQPATAGDIAKAATTVLQQLAPITHALTQQASPQAVKPAALQAQTAPVLTPLPAAAQSVADAPIDTTPQPITANPLLVANDAAAPSAINPLLNPAMNTPNPVLQTVAVQTNAQANIQAAVVSANNAAATTAETQLAESQLGIDATGFDLAGGAHSLARYDAGSLAKAGRLSNTAAGAVLPANIQVAVQLARAAKSGDKSFNIQLHPAELGRVEVKLEVDSRGGATARVLVDSQATLDLLQTHRAGLERALTDAGLNCDTGGISFDLRPNDQNNQGAQQHAGGRHANRNNEAAALSGTADASVDPSIIANLTLSLQPGRIDIKA